MCTSRLPPARQGFVGPGKNLAEEHLHLLLGSQIPGRGEECRNAAGPLRPLRQRDCVLTRPCRDVGDGRGREQRRADGRDALTLKHGEGRKLAAGATSDDVLYPSRLEEREGGREGVLVDFLLLALERRGHGEDRS